MEINFNVAETLSALFKTPPAIFLAFLAFVSSFNTWFLSIYFFAPHFIPSHGLTIALLVAFGFTVPWLLLSYFIVEGFIFKSLKANQEKEKANSKSLDSKQKANTEPIDPKVKLLLHIALALVFAILFQGACTFANYKFQWGLIPLIYLAFGVAGVLFCIYFLHPALQPLLCKKASTEQQAPAQQQASPLNNN